MAVQLTVPLKGSIALSASTTPEMGYANIYDASTAALTPTLPPLSTLSIGAHTLLEKGDASAYSVTFTCYGTDTFIGGGTTEVLQLPGQVKELEVVTSGGSRHWKVVGGHTSLEQLDLRFGPLVNKITPVWHTTDLSQAEATYPAIVGIGDSLIGGCYSAQLSPNPLAGYSGTTIPVCMMVKNRWPGSFVPVGVSGEQANTGRARFATDVLPKKPKVILVVYGSNDVVLNRLAPDIFADLLAMWTMGWRSGASIIATTCPPRDAFTSAQMKEALKLNAMLHNFAASNPAHFALLDIWTILADPSTGHYRTGYSQDGTHPNSTASWAVALKSVAIFTSLFPSPATTLAVCNTNDDNLVSNPMLITTGGATGAGATGTVASTFTVYGSDATMTITASLVDRASTDGFGQWQQITTTVASDMSKTTSIITTINSGFTAGDIIQGSLEFETDSDGWTNGMFNLFVICQSSGGTALNMVGAYAPESDNTIKTRPDNGVLQTPPLTIPASTNVILFALQKTGLGTMRLGRFAIRKLPTA